MRTFLLTWNPNRWPWDYISQSIADVNNRGYSDDQWSCGNRRNVDIGDRVFLMRLGIEPRGIVASGFVTSVPFDRPHWDADRAANGDTSIHVRLRFDAITEQPAIVIAELDSPPFDSVHWHSQSSGVLIPPETASALEQLWGSRVNHHQSCFPEELAPCPVYIEGLGRQVVVNAYERNHGARQKCIEHFGYTCTCCRVLLSSIYGEFADDLIHVHHLVPISEIGASYEIDPVKDLVPVCPNCHAIIHHRRPPLTVTAVQKLLTATCSRANSGQKTTETGD